MGRQKRGRTPAGPSPAAQLEELYAAIPDAGCKGLCTASCGSNVATEAERARVAERGVLLPLIGHYGDAGCPALVDGRCSVYEVRPLICRLFASAEGLECPYGCVPASGVIPRSDAQRMIGRAGVISRRATA